MEFLVRDVSRTFFRFTFNVNLKTFCNTFYFRSMDLKRVLRRNTHKYNFKALNQKTVCIEK